jgi:hypothetical protein
VIEIFGLAAVICTFSVTAWLAWLQHDANKIYEHQAYTAQAANEIYKQEVYVAKDTEERELRAYLHLIADKVVFSDTGPTSVHVVITNDGQTPAHDVVIRAELVIMKYPLAKNIVLHAGYEPLVPKLYLAPHASQDNEITTAGVLSQESLFSITGDDKRLYLLGELEYWDIFNIKRNLRFGICIGGPEVRASFDARIKAGKTTPYISSGRIGEIEPSNNYEY